MYWRGLQNVLICFIEWAHAICANLGYGGSFSSSDSRNDERSQVWCCMRGKHIIIMVCMLIVKCLTNYCSYCQFNIPFIFSQFEEWENFMIIIMSSSSMHIGVLCRFKVNHGNKPASQFLTNINFVRRLNLDDCISQ